MRKYYRGYRDTKNKKNSKDTALFILFLILIAIIVVIVRSGVVVSSTPVTIQLQSIEEPTIAYASDVSDVDTAPVSTSWDGIISVSAYNAMESQTDDTPTITANGDYVYEGGIASNCYPFGTKIEIEGVGVFTVNDRMNRRYHCDNADIFMWSYSDAIEFGRQELRYRVIQE